MEMPIDLFRRKRQLQAEMDRILRGDGDDYTTRQELEELHSRLEKALEDIGEFFLSISKMEEYVETTKYLDSYHHKVQKFIMDKFTTKSKCKIELLKPTKVYFDHHELSPFDYNSKSASKLPLNSHSFHPISKSNELISFADPEDPLIPSSDVIDHKNNSNLDPSLPANITKNSDSFTKLETLDSEYKVSVVPIPTPRSSRPSSVQSNGPPSPTPRRSLSTKTPPVVTSEPRIHSNDESVRQVANTDIIQPQVEQQQPVTGFHGYPQPIQYPMYDPRMVYPAPYPPIGWPTFNQPHSQNNDGLAPLQLHKFHGERAQYDTWRTLFSNLVDCKPWAEHIKMTRLIQSLGEKPLQFIKSLGGKPGEYIIALEILDDEYKHHERPNDNPIRNLENYPKLSNG